MRRRRPIVLLGLAALLALLALPGAAAAADRGPKATTSVFNIFDYAQLLVTLGGGRGDADAASAHPDGDAEEPVISMDSRIARVIAYTSSATNLAGGPTGGVRNVYVVHRKRGWGRNGTAWRAGRTVRISQGLGGAAPDGPSWAAAVDGDERHAPRCVAFVSKASNLVRGDRNGRADVFVHRLGRRKLKRVKVSGDATDVAVARRCGVFAWASTNGVWVKAGGRARRVTNGAGASDLMLTMNGSVLVYDRGGRVYAYDLERRRLRDLGPGREPVIDGYGRWVVYAHDGRIWERTPSGGRRKRLMRGSDPTLTSGGHFVYWTTPGFVRLNVKKSPVGYCPAGEEISDPADEDVPAGEDEDLLDDGGDLLDDEEGPLLRRIPPPDPKDDLSGGGQPRDPMSSSHGNYLVFTCDHDDRPDTVVLQYLGPK